MRLFERPDGRYYVIYDPEYDLLGDRVVVTRRGTRYSRRGGSKTYFGADPRQLDRVILSIAKTRIRHGYSEVLCSGPADQTLTT